jgi:hypothetical protein
VYLLQAAGRAFNREHVIPQAFGSYGAETLVLINMVCSECNSTLGGTLDQIFSRDSYEGLLRSQSLEEGQTRGERFESRRFRIYLRDEERYGIVRGARITIDWNTRRPRLLDQVIVRVTTGELHRFLPDEFASVDEHLLENLPPGAVRIVGTDPGAVETLMDLVRAKGIRLGDRQSVDTPRALTGTIAHTDIEGWIDERVWRAVAKIA